MKTIAVLTGGPAAEREISLKSARTVFEHLPRDRYRPYLIELRGKVFVEVASATPLDLNDFSLTVDGEKIAFDAVYGSIHGSPYEDGRLQGYFEMLGIAYTGGAPPDMALTFDKQLTKAALRPHGLPLAQSIRMRRTDKLDPSKITHLKFPLFVKPNANGSSYGVSKVEQLADLTAAVAKAFQYDQSVLIEEFLDGREFTQGVYRNASGEVVVLPLTEIRTGNSFFDFDAKYQGNSEEITPADVPETDRIACSTFTQLIYELLGMKGVSRVDYILRDGLFYMLEINTVPGMSEASIIPQQCAAAGVPLGELLHAVLVEALA